MPAEYNSQQVYNDFVKYKEQGLDPAVAAELAKACAIDRLVSAVGGVEYVIGLLSNKDETSR